MSLRPFQFALAGLISLLTQIAFADPPRPNHDSWQNSNYQDHYVLYDNATRTYVETVGCRALWRFTKIGEDLNDLYLYEASRGMTMKLNYDGMFLKAAGAADYTFYQSGSFDLRMMFGHVDANNNFNGSIVKRDGCLWEEYFPGNGTPTFRFRQTAVNAGAIDIYDATRDLTVRMDQTRMYLKQGNAAFNLFEYGNWSAL